MTALPAYRPAPSFFQWVETRRWIWSLAGIAILWLVLSVLTSRFSLQSLSGVAASAAFLLFPSLGQMIVVTTGRGNIDLSIPSVITLSAFLSVNIVDGSDARLALGLGAVAAVGLGVGAVNAFLVLALRIPAMIATLATGYILATATLLANRSFSTYRVSPMLAWFATGKVAGVPVIVLAALSATALAAFVLSRTVFGRALSAVGQNRRAAELAGVPASRVIAIAFLVSGAAAGLTGALLSARAGGAFLDMGSPFLLQSVGAVVLGGTLIFGGCATAFGTLCGSVLLVLIVTTMQIAGLPGGTQEIIQGVVIIAVLALAGVAGRESRR
jgi:ribose transport system permease protein